MADYRITFARSARRDMESLDPPVGRRVLDRIMRLAGDSRPPGCIRLAGATDLWRIRIGDWRAIYTVDDTSRNVDIVAVRHRSDAYR